MSPAIRAEITALGEANRVFHQAMLDHSRPRADELDDPGPEGFHKWLTATRQVLVLLAHTRLQDYEKWKRTVPISELHDHPHWDLAFTSILDELYPRAVGVLTDEIKTPHLPGNLSYELVRRGLWNPDESSEPPPHLPSLDFLSALIGQVPVSIDSFLSGLQSNIFNLRAQLDDERRNTPSPRVQYVPVSSLPAERAVYHVAATIGINAAIKYLEALWRDGWLHNEFLYSRLWLWLYLQSTADEVDERFTGDWKNYIGQIRGHWASAPPSDSTVLAAAERILDRFRRSIANSREQCSDLSEWIIDIHQHALYLTAMSILKSMIEKSSVVKSVRDEMTRLWRYAMEAHADIDIFIANPFSLPLEKLAVSMWRHKDARSRMRELRYWSYGRIAVPSAVLNQVFALGSSDLYGDRDVEFWEGQISQIFLTDMSAVLRDAYTRACYLTHTELILADAPEESNSPADQNRADTSSIRVRQIATMLFLCRLWYRGMPISGTDQTFKTKLTDGTVLLTRRFNADPIALHLTTNVSHAVQLDHDTLPVEGQGIEERALASSASLLQLMCDVMDAIDIFCHNSRFDRNALKQVTFEANTEPYSCVLDFVNGQPTTFIVQRRVVPDKAPKPMTPDLAKIFGIVGTHALVLLRSDRSNRFDNVEIRCIVPVSAEHQLTVSLGKVNSAAQEP